MTLIFSHVDSVTGLLAGSDILLSRPATDGPRAVTLPFRETPLVHESQDYTFGRLAQKMVIFDRTMVLWSGSEVIARAIIAEIHRKSGSGANQIDVRETFDGLQLLESELDAVGIIYHYNSGDGVFRHSFNCSAVRADSTGGLIADGSGTDHFFDEIVARRSDRLTALGLPVELIAKAVGHSVYEFSGGTVNLDHLYGGWFELGTTALGGFQKLPYAIKFWSRSDGILHSGGPIFFGFYDESRLAVLTIQPKEIDRKVTFDHRFELIPDHLGRGRASGLPKVIHKPEFVAHMIFEHGSGWHICYIESPRDFEDTMILEAGPSGFRVAYSNGLRQRLLDRQLPEDFTIARRSDDPR